MTFEVIDDPWFWTIAVPAVILTGISKGGLGGGAGGVATPLLALVIAPAQGAAIMLPILCVMDLVGIGAYMNRWDRRIMRIILPAGLAGMVLGALAFRHMNDHWIRVLLGVISLGFFAWSLLPRRIAAAKPSDRSGYFWSLVSGFTGFVTHSGSPPLLVYLLPHRLDKVVFISTLLVYFAAMNFTKIAPYSWLGLLDFRNLATSLALIPIGIAGTYLGVWLQARISVAAFYRIVLAVLFVTGAKLLYDGVVGLAG